VWDRLRKQVALEREQLHRLLDTSRPFMEQCASSPPNSAELFALAATLHSFYNGFENIFKRIAVELDGGLTDNEFWHRELLDSMARPTDHRPAILSEQMIERLDDYLAFRHFFRHAYLFNLEWDRMKPLVLGCQETLDLVEAELEQFFRAAPGGGK
jgi:hypothetical protein